MSYRQREAKEELKLMIDPEKKEYFHLIDGGVADNLGLRAIEEIHRHSGQYLDGYEENRQREHS